MIQKNYLIEFAHPTIKAVDHLDDIRMAIAHASSNLLSRYGIELGRPLVTENNSVTVTVGIPDEMVIDFNAGNRLRGISRYLLKSCSFPYQDYLIGTRLMTYTDWSAGALFDEHYESWTPICVDKSGHEWFLVERFTKHDGENDG